MWHHCAARQQPVDCSRKHYISQQRPLVNYVLAVVAQRRLVGRIAAAASKITVPTTAAPSRILFIGGLPAKTAAGELEQQLLSVCESVGCQPTRVKVGHSLSRRSTSISRLRPGDQQTAVSRLWVRGAHFVNGQQFSHVAAVAKTLLSC
jgi:hypothetical protein